METVGKLGVDVKWRNYYGFNDASLEKTNKKATREGVAF